MNTNTWARPIVIPWDASPISHANRALRPARSDSPDLFLVQQRRVFALVEDSDNDNDNNGASSP